MTIDEYVKEQKEALDKFKVMWGNGVKDAPDYFPVALTPGEWDEQFQIYNPHD